MNEEDGITMSGWMKKMGVWLNGEDKIIMSAWMKICDNRVIGGKKVWY